VIALGIETATELVGVAVADDDGPRAAVWATGRRRHTESLAPAIVHVTEQAGVALAEVTLLVVDVGPGLFTGLRVGVATAKALGQALGRPVVGLTSLEVLAAAAFDAGAAGEVVAVVDARRGEVFAGRFAPPGPDGRPRPLAPPVLRRPDALAEELAAPAASDGPVGRRLLVGDGALRYRELLEGRAGSVAGPSLAAPPPGVLVALGAAQADRAQPAADVHPLYLRDADARANFAVRPAGAR
jgi:tRNA threonylcarbamoyladenosine biosynthesis protein TsaB